MNQGLALVVLVVGLSMSTARGAEDSQRRATEPSASLAAAMELVRGKTGGRVLSVMPLAEREDGGGFRVRVLLDGGRVTTIEIDESGQLRGGR